MFKTNYHARVGFTRVIDRICPTCKGVWSSNEHSACPKCGGPLSQTSVQTDKGTRPYCFTEVTIYPVMPEKFQKVYTDKMQKSKSLGFVVRLKLWGHYDEVTGRALPDNRTEYLTPKKEVIVDIMTPPYYSVFNTKGNVPVVQILHEITSKDSITYVGPKDAYNIAAVNTATVTAAIAPSPTPVTKSSVTKSVEMDALSSKVDMLANNLNALLNALGGNMGGTKTVASPSPSPTPMMASTVVDATGGFDHSYDGSGSIILEGGEEYSEGISLFQNE